MIIIKKVASYFIIKCTTVNICYKYRIKNFEDNCYEKNNKKNIKMSLLELS
jgi:hypothetical protein